MTETVLSDEQIDNLLDGILKAAGSSLNNYAMYSYLIAMHQAVRGVEAAVLQSPEVVAMRKDAERYRWLRDRNDWHHEPRIPESSGTFWQVATYSPYVITDVTDDDNLDNSVDASMEAES